MFKSNIETIPHSKQRYETIGDWKIDKAGNIKIKVSSLGDWRFEFLVGIHELIEVVLCRHRGITGQSVDEFDMSHLDLDEPGEDPQAPYHKEHMLAMDIERMLASELSVDWEEYSKAIDKCSN